MQSVLIFTHGKSYLLQLIAHQHLESFQEAQLLIYNNTSGFGTTENPPIVAIYTEHQNDESNQSQCLAFSVDEGLTFTKYEGNPVLDINLPNFPRSKGKLD